MSLDWSDQSPHIRSLFRPWRSGDGYEEEAIAAAEARCLGSGGRLAATLRAFYATWGRRRDLTQMDEILLPPDEWFVHSGALIFCVENQGCAYWAVSLGSVEAADPEVLIADDGPGKLAVDPTAELAWERSHSRVSAFLDALTYGHAFARGALHGAWSDRARPTPEQAEWFESQWRTASVSSLALKGPEETRRFGSPLYVREGQAVHWFQNFWAVADSAEALDGIARALGIDWEQRW